LDYELGKFELGHIAHWQLVQIKDLEQKFGRLDELVIHSNQNVTFETFVFVFVSGLATAVIKP